MAIHSSVLAGKSHGQKSLAGYSPWGHKELDTTERLSTPIYFLFNYLFISIGLKDTTFFFRLQSSTIMIPILLLTLFKFCSLVVFSCQFLKNPILCSSQVDFQQARTKIQFKSQFKHIPKTPSNFIINEQYFSYYDKSYHFPSTRHYLNLEPCDSYKLITPPTYLCLTSDYHFY